MEIIIMSINSERPSNFILYSKPASPVNGEDQPLLQYLRERSRAYQPFFKFQFNSGVNQFSKVKGFEALNARISQPPVDSPMKRAAGKILKLRDQNRAKPYFASPRTVRGARTMCQLSSARNLFS
jgi:hypothetical protein